MSGHRDSLDSLIVTYKNGQKVIIQAAKVCRPYLFQMALQQMLCVCPVK